MTNKLNLSMVMALILVAAMSHVLAEKELVNDADLEQVLEGLEIQQQPEESPLVRDKRSPILAKLALGKLVLAKATAAKVGLGLAAGGLAYKKFGGYYGGGPYHYGGGYGGGYYRRGYGGGHYSSGWY